ncbi:gp16 family protein [Pararhodobacter zhoushanensis]|uniref:Regulatory protein GemA n=1 Tax=Pararhodobacter zhoushanensis TaxID=2479545 RepID=A0ABT3H2P4_9RHOB|nr:regulatory protein GemA [Pararhodobacter zhoushanensis]MCW1934100.1 regulatory protein GemA [Pararhodobacter zhoushanensis]
MNAAMIRKVHVGCRQLGLDTETRHDLQRQITGKDSLSAMSEPELKAVLKALENRGFNPAARGRHKPAPRADLRYVHKLWTLLGTAGALRQPGRAGLNAFLRERFAASWGSVPADIDMLREAAQIADLIDALKAMCRRAGVDLDP